MDALLSYFNASGSENIILGMSLFGSEKEATVSFTFLFSPGAVTKGFFVHSWFVLYFYELRPQQHLKGQRHEISYSFLL